MNRYSPHYDHDEGKLSMGLDGEGGWVHINSVDARAVKKLEREVAQVREAYAEMVSQRNAFHAALHKAERQIATLRTWMAEYPNDKYTGTWWLSEFDRIAALAAEGKLPR